ncbi:YhgE/Pip domain-containing protein [Paenibacillus sp. D2_2]|uniref:YhgE/Pip domain-containing protein n=1 Tax=Paenibacillus sp. D2_2 TaxID=3073092 RepID=UPI002814B295|nr:YhgE/Pip domain-containing protein [Paenibacillus sp. D2_2]WMT39070.1 YhgE/Pip domain-containing protein [Paenibacillus sp. D2_2]
MKKILYIYRSDLHGIITNWAAAIIISGLIFLPSLYAWFNIGASWDPYGQTSGIKIAVANEDTGTTMRGQSIALGKEIVTSLHENHNIGWVFTDRDKAIRGLKYGKYYAVIIIPANFSARIATVLTPNPEKAEIQYYVNEKINAVAPKITAKGASSIISEVSANFVKTANGAIFRIFNDIGVELKQELPLINNARQLAFQMVQLFPQINEAANIAVSDLQKGQTIVTKVQKELPFVADLAQKGEGIAGQTSDFLARSRDAVQSAGPVAKETLEQLKLLADLAGQTSNNLLTGLDVAEDLGTLQLPEHLENALTVAADGAGSLSKLLSRLQSIAPSSSLSAKITELNRIETDFRQMAQLLKDIKASADQGKDVTRSLLEKFNALAADASGRLDGLIGSFDSTILPAISAALEQAQKDANHTKSILSEALSDLPVVSDIIKDAKKGLVVATTEAKTLRGHLPEAERKLKEVTDRITALEKKGSLEDLIKLLSLNYAKESDFFAEPVILKETRMFPIPNYGSAMSPFFTTLSLWVGGLLLVSMLTVEVHNKTINGVPLRSYHEYFGRFFTFLTLALLQSLFVTTGDLWILGTYAAEPLRFILFGLLISAVFMLMIYTLVSVFGNVGKAMAIVLLVLQLAGSAVHSLSKSHRPSSRRSILICPLLTGSD